MAPDSPAEGSERVRSDLEFLKRRVESAIADLNGTGRLDAMRTWLKGSNGPIAIAAYEALVQDAFKVVTFLEATLGRIGGSDEPLPEGTKQGTTDLIREGRDHADLLAEADPTCGHVHPSECCWERQRLAAALRSTEAERDRATQEFCVHSSGQEPGCLGCALGRAHRAEQQLENDGHRAGAAEARLAEVEREREELRLRLNDWQDGVTAGDRGAPNPGAADAAPRPSEGSNAEGAES